MKPWVIEPLTIFPSTDETDWVTAEVDDLVIEIEH